MFESEPKIENKPEIEKQPQVEFEVTPVEAVKGLNELTVLRRIADISWGKESDIDKEIDNLPKDEKDEIKKIFNDLMAIAESNEEALELAAVAKGKSAEAREGALKYLIRYKGFKKEEAEEFLQRSLDLLDEASQRYPKMIEILNEKTELDRQEKERDSEQIRKYIDKAVDFLNLKSETTRKLSIHLLPNDPIKPIDCKGFKMDEDIYIISKAPELSGLKDLSALENLTPIGITVHECLHGMINPITEKIELDKQQEKRILDLVSFRLRKAKSYKGNASSLLNESLIRAYPLQFIGGRQISLKDFRRQTGIMTEESFQEMKTDVEQNGLSIKSKTLEEFKEFELESFYNEYLKDKLADKISNFYKDYMTEKERQADITFEDYFIKNYKELLK